MCVLLFDVFKHLLLEKTDILKICRKSKFLGEKNLKKCTIFEEQKGTRCIRENVYFGIIIFSCLSSAKQCLRFVLDCSTNKRLLSEFLWKWGWFQGHYERFPKYLDKKLKFQRTETRCCRWKSTDNNDIFLSLENPCTFLLAKEKTWKRIFDTNSELSTNSTEKQIMSFKTTVNWLFNDLCCYLVIGCSDWKIGVFQQTDVKGLLYP